MVFHIISITFYYIYIFIYIEFILNQYFYPFSQLILIFISFYFSFANSIILSFPYFLTNSSNVVGVFLSIVFNGLHPFLFAPEPQVTFLPDYKYGIIYTHSSSLHLNSLP